MTTRDLAIQWFDQVWNQRNRAAIQTLVDPACLGKSEGGDFLSPDHFKVTHFEPLIRAFPDMQMDIDGIITEGDTAAVRWTATATHTGTWLGIPPTGVQFQFSAMSWLEFHEGRILRSYDHFNLHGLIAFLAGKGEVPSIRVLNRPDRSSTKQI